MLELSSWNRRISRSPLFLLIPRCLLALVVLFLSGCGDSDPGTSNQTGVQPSNVESPNDDAEAEFAAALGAGQGGGTLIFDGTSYAIESAICNLGEYVEVGTVGEGYRVMIDRADRPRASILDPQSVHWTNIDWQTQNFTVTGSVVTSSATNYRNNRDKRVIEASFEIECP